MQTRVIDHDGIKYLTLPSNENFRLTTGSVNVMIGECLGLGISRVFLDEHQLPEEFFALRTLEAGGILQSLRNYGIRLAIVISPHRLDEGRFAQMAAEELKGQTFGAFSDAQRALAWLLQPDPTEQPGM